MTFPIKLTRPLTVFDLETTGTDPQTARIVEIAITRVLPEGKHTNHWTLVNPGVSIPAAATAIHNIADEHVLGKPRFEDLAPKLAKVFTDCDYAGYNLKRYDIVVLDAEFKRAGVPWSSEGASVLDGYVLWQLLQPRKLSDAVRFFCEREPSGPHAASADTSDAYDVITAMLEQNKDRWPMSLPELHALQFPVNPNRIDQQGKFEWQGGTASLTFGKHKGQPLHDVPRAYFQWLQKQEFAFDAKVIIDNAVRGEFPLR
jgi:DNA polymerase-3 subunit epsilon